MATDSVVYANRPPMTVAELLAFTKKELDADAERQARLHAASAGELPRDSQTGATLDLSHKNIQALPLEVIIEIKDKVERLALSHNPQISVPTSIVQCDRLRYLNIRWNNLNVFPDAVLQLHKLEILDLSKNRIVLIPEDIKKMTSLKFLAVARNKITRLPLSLGDMSSLRKLKFDENPIEFPPPEALKPSQDRAASMQEAEEEKDVCQRVKRYLRQVAAKQRPKTGAEEEASESNLETPRPPRRTALGGRFPIRPSISGVEIMTDGRSNSPSENAVPPVPQRSHARIASTNAPLMKRPGIAPLVTSGNDINRSRSETVSSSASLRQRRQGFVQKKAAADLKSVSEVPTMPSHQPKIPPHHTRATSSISTTNSLLAPGSGEASSDALSPVDGRFDSIREPAGMPISRKPMLPINDKVKAPRRLLFILHPLQKPFLDVAGTLKADMVGPHRSTLERKILAGSAHLKELGRLLKRTEQLRGDGGLKEPESMKAVIHTSLRALGSYRAIMADLKFDAVRIPSFTTAIHVRQLLFQLYTAAIELRNVCSVLGFQVKERSTANDTPRVVSKAWSSKTVTPTQPKPSTSKRLRGATILQSIGGNPAIRQGQPPPPIPLNVSRSNTMTSMSSVTTPKSNDSFGTLARGLSTTSSASTIRPLDAGEPDEQFDRIFLKLQAACNLASEALPHCRKEFQSRKGLAHTAGQGQLAHRWSVVLGKCDDVVQNSRNLKKRLEVVKVNDPGLRYQKDFWQLCDAFVLSWTDLATEIKEISTHRVDITTIKQIMRNVQRRVKDVSKTIMHSSLYHQALGMKSPDSASARPELGPAFTSGIQYAAHSSIISTQSGYVTPVPATPLSAALGPAAQATMANPTSGYNIPRDYFHDAQTSRPVRERHDTVMQAQGYARRQEAYPR